MTRFIFRHERATRTGRRWTVQADGEYDGEYVAVLYLRNGEISVTDIRRDLPRGTGRAIRDAFLRDQALAEINRWIDILNAAAREGVPYTGREIAEGLTAASAQDNVLDLLRDAVKAGELTQAESIEIQLQLPY